MRRAIDVPYGWVLCLALLSAVPARADDAVLGRMAHLATHYHEDVSRLDAGVKELERLVAAEPTPAALAMLARITYIWAGARATTRDEKLAAYERGRDAAERALQRDPSHADARYWRASNYGRIVETTGGVKAVLRGIGFNFVDEMKTILGRDPRYIPAYGFLGAYYLRLPWPLGSVDEAATMYAKAVALDPHGSQQRVGLAKALIEKKKIADAREHLQRVVDEMAPTNPAERALHDLPEARRLLETLLR
jgi:tetratricopeptide (TPR) repeat protein